MATNKKDEPKEPAKPAQPRVPRGKAIIRTDEEIDELFGPEALKKRLDEAMDDWKENAPAEFKNLLDAGEVEEE